MYFYGMHREQRKVYEEQGKKAGDRFTHGVISAHAGMIGGALGGAATGTAVCPVVGTAIGALAGGAMGAVRGVQDETLKDNARTYVGAVGRLLGFLNN